MNQYFWLMVLALMAFGEVLPVAYAKSRVVVCTASQYVAYPQVIAEEYGLDADHFCLASDPTQGHVKVDGFREALAATRLLVIGPYQSGSFPNLDLILGDSKNREAVREFLKNGGSIVFDQTNMNTPELSKFFAQIGVTVPKSAALPQLAKNQVQMARAAKDGADARHPLLSFPNRLEHELNPRVFSAYSSWSDKQIAPLRSSQNPALAVVVVQDGVLGAGRVIFNTTGQLSSTKSDGTLMAENLYSYALGVKVNRVPPPRTRYLVPSGWQIWSKNPYAPFPLQRNAPELAPLQQIALSAAVNERLSNQVLITNAASGPAVELGIEVGELRSVDGVLAPVVVRELAFEHPDNRYPDRLDLTKGLKIEPGETRLLWLTVDTYNAKPGEYKSELVLTAAGGTVRKLPLNVQVLPIMLPTDNPLRFTTWELFFGWRDQLVEGRQNWKHYQQDMVDHGVSVFHVVFDMPPRIADEKGNLALPPEAFTRLRDRFITLDKRSFYLIYGNIEEAYRSKVKGQSDLKYPSPEHARAYKAYLGEMIRFLKGVGLGYDQFAFYPYDEISASKVESALVNYAAIKEVDPQAKIFLTLGGNSENEFFETKRGRPVKELAPYVDIWCPGIQFYTHFANPKSSTAIRVAKVLEFCKQTGKEVWSYNVTTRSSYEQAPYQRYRLKPWGAYALGLGGYGFFGMNQWKQGDTYTAIYPGPHPVPSIRWEAVREGMNDVKYMIVLREEIVRAKQAGKQTEAAEKLLTLALEEVNAQSLDTSLAPAYRDKIAAMILQLRR